MSSKYLTFSASCVMFYLLHLVYVIQCLLLTVLSQQSEKTVIMTLVSRAIGSFKHELPSSSASYYSDQYTTYPSNGEVVRAEADVFNQSLLIYYRERWNFLCGDSFSQAEADVACHQMGYPGGATKFSRFA